MIPALPDERDRIAKRDFIIKLSKWDNSLDLSLIATARKSILESNGQTRPRMLDPFAGGGAIPLEGVRLGYETFASDYNPVAVLVLKCTLEFPQKYGAFQAGVREDSAAASRSGRILADVTKWASWVLEEASKEISAFYSPDPDGSVPVGYLWARTIPCQNPTCGTEIPLMRQFWLAKNKSRKISLHPYVSGKKVAFRIVGTGYDKMPSGFDPDRGTVAKSIVSCPICGSITDGDTTRDLFMNKKSGERMIAVVLHKEGKSGKRYRISIKADEEVFKEAQRRLATKRKELQIQLGFNPVPDEPLPPRDTLGFRVQRYGMTEWGDLFNSRQQLALIVFLQKVRNSYAKMVNDEKYDNDYARAVVTYLAIMLDRLADKGSNLVVYNSVGEKVEHVFGRQTVSMVWDYVEVNPFTSVGWPNMKEWVEKVIDHCSRIPRVAPDSQPPAIAQSSATSLPFPDNYFDAVFTDPPYYDNVPYSHLSDFFYVWLKRSVGALYPELFSTPLTPKSQEIVAYPSIPGGLEAAKHIFEQGLKKSFLEIYRVLKLNGISIIVYTHKSTSGWETLVNSLVDSGLVVTAAWPIRTEMKARLRARESAALASSIYMVARKFGKEQTGFYKEVKQDIKDHLETRLDALWKEGISGADFFIAAIGSSIEIFGKYNKVIDDEGNIIRADRFLEDIRKIVTDYAVKQVLRNGIAGDIDPMTRFYVLWRWAYGEERLDFDDARKLAQGVGIKLEQEWDKGFVEKENEFIDLLGPEDRVANELEGSTALIDVLHQALLLWKGGKNEQMLKVLNDSGFGKSNVFYRVAQAISESLPSGSKEKQLLEGFLQGRQRISEDIRKQSKQTKLVQ